MIDRRSAYDRCVADLEMARIMLNNLTNRRSASESEIHKARVHAKELEVKLAAAKLAQADYHLSSLKARLDFLEARCSKECAATKKEQSELAWAREAVPVNTTTVARLAAELEQHKREFGEMIAGVEQVDNAA